MGILDAADKYMLQMLAEAFQGYNRAQDAIDKYGDLILSDGVLHKNPASAMLNSNRSYFHSALSSLGLGPAARARIGAAGSSGPDEFEQLLARAGQKKN